MCSDQGLKWDGSMWNRNPTPLINDQLNLIGSEVDFHMLQSGDASN